MNKLAVILLVILSVCACQEKTIPPGKNSSFDKEMNITYGTDSEQKLDLYTPSSSKQVKDVFIIIHGGGWRAGDKSQLTSFAVSMMQKFPKSIFAAINYRTASETRFGIPNQTDDIQKAMLFLEKTMNYQPNFILIGNSAGGHLSMLYAYQGDNNKKIKAVINIVGPSDLSDPNFKNYSDYTFVKNHLVDPAIIPERVTMVSFASPIYWINRNSPPTISFFGNNDQVIPLSQKSILDSALNKNDIYNQSFEFPGGHLDWMNEKNSSFVIDKIDAFLKQVK